MTDWKRRAGWGALAATAAFVSLLVASSVAADRDAGLPDRLEMVAPVAGDAARYTVVTERFDTRWAPVPFTVEAVEAVWDGPDRLRLQASYHFWASDHPYDSAVFQEVAYGPDAAGSAAPAIWVRNHEAFPEIRRAGTHVDAGPLQIHQGDEVLTDAWFQTDFFAQWGAPCGFHPVFLGQETKVEGPVDLGGTCHDLGGDPGPFHLEGQETVAGVDTFRFQHVNDPEVRVWYNPAIPFPVQVRDHFTDLFEPTKTFGHVFVWTLAGLQSGAGASEPAEGGSAAPVPVQPAAIPTVPYDGRVPDETGIDHPFPLGRAWDIALERDSSFATFLAGRPQAFIGEAHHWQAEDQAGRAAWQWKFVVTDGERHFDLVVTWEPGVPGDLALAGLPVEAATVTVEPWDSGLPGDVRGLYPMPDQIPRMAPSLAASFERSEEVHGVPADWYETRLMCTFGDCGDVRFWFDVGTLDGSWNADDLPTVPGSLEAGATDFRGLRLAPDGTVLQVGSATAEPAHAPLLPLEAAPPEERAAGIEGTWSAPDGPTLAGAGVVAAAIGILVASWSVLKTGLVGLFSRVTRAAALRNPRRARVHALIMENPGIHFQDLARRTGQGSGALEHHLHKLQETGLVRATKTAGYTCYFPPGLDRRLMAASGALKADSARRILEEVVASGHATPRALAQRLGLSPGTVSHHLRRMRDAGLLEGGGREGYRPLSHAAQAVAAA